MTSWLESQKCILTKQNTRWRRFRLRKNNEVDKTSDPIQSNPNFSTRNWTQSNPIQPNPTHGWIQSMSNSATAYSWVL